MNDLQYSADDVRGHLYDVWNQLRMEWNDHLSAAKNCKWPECQICAMYKGRLQGVMRAIRRFGGRNRRAS